MLHWKKRVRSEILLNSALDRGGRRWKEVLQLFQLQLQLHVEPNGIFYGHVLSAMASSIQWRPALTLLSSSSLDTQM
eukprot:symbB.v1.2.027063.t1/scaffold2750.1/size124631/8